MEEWRDIKGYEGLYQVSNEGRVRSFDRIIKQKTKLANYKIFTMKGRILKTASVNRGYLAVQLWKDGIAKMRLIHRLVAEAFIPNPDNLPQVNHKDEDKENNFVFINEDGSVNLEKSNLEWCSEKYNANFGTAIARRVEKQSKQVDQLDGVTGELIRRWESTNECGRNGYTQSSVSQCCRGLRKKHKGYIWRFYQI